MTSADWHRVIDTNLTGVYHCCHAAIPHLKARGGGWIINVSSLAASNPLSAAPPTARRRRASTHSARR